MGKLTSFNFVTLNGFYKGPGNDTSWHKHENNEIAEEGVATNNTLIFGRITYEMMAAFWPSPEAKQMMPVIAEGMNRAKKIVFSKTLKTAAWENSLLSTDMEAEIKKRKQTDENMTILGSGSIVSQLAILGLVDEFMLLVDPLVIGSGTPMFHNIEKQIQLSLINHRFFKNGSVMLTYKPA